MSEYNPMVIRKEALQVLVTAALDAYRADLRAKVEALRDEASRIASDLGGDHWYQGSEEAYQKVLDLIDGSNDE